MRRIWWDQQWDSLSLCRQSWVFSQAGRSTARTATPEHVHVNDLRLVRVEQGPPYQFGIPVTAAGCSPESTLVWPSDSTLLNYSKPLLKETFPPTSKTQRLSTQTLSKPTATSPKRWPGVRTLFPGPPHKRRGAGSANDLHLPSASFAAMLYRSCR